MTLVPPLYIAGVGMTPFSAHHDDATMVDLAAVAIDEALEDAAITGADIDELVFANESDHFSGRLTPSVAVVAEAGLAPMPATRVEAGGATGSMALRTGASLLRSGSAEAVLVCGAEKTGRDVPVAVAQEVFALSADNDFEFPVGVTFPALYAMSFRLHMDLYGTTMDQAAAVTVKNLRNAAGNPKAHRHEQLSIADVRRSVPVACPYRALDCSLLSDGAAAVVLATEAWMAARGRKSGPVVALVGSGTATTAPRLGDRLVGGAADLANFRAKAAAATAAYRQAGITDPPTEIDVAEVYDSFSGAEIQAYEGLGFCKQGKGGVAAAEGRFDVGGRPVVNPSGGLLGRGAASGATGLAQVYEITRQLQGDAGQRQVPDARKGLTDTHAGIASICVVHVFERRESPSDTSAEVMV